MLKDKSEQIREQPNSQHDAKRRPAEAKDSQHNKVDCGRVPVRFGGQEYQSHNQHCKGKAGGKDGGEVIGSARQNFLSATCGRRGG